MRLQLNKLTLAELCELKVYFYERRASLLSNLKLGSRMCAIGQQRRRYAYLARRIREIQHRIDNKESQSTEKKRQKIN